VNFRSLVISALTTSAFLSPLISTKASAEIITVTYTGTVTGGWDTGGVFGSTAANAYLGDPYTEVFTFDSSLGSLYNPANSTEYAGTWGLTGGPQSGAPTAVSPGISVTMNLNGYSFSFSGVENGHIQALNIPPGYGEQSGISTTMTEQGIGSATASIGSPTGGPTGIPADIFIPFTYFAQPGDDGNADFLVPIGPSGVDIHTFASEVQLSVGAVPEPSTWAMMILGFAGIGFMAYRRKAKPALLTA
jgi:PEP-CTERM motif